MSEVLTLESKVIKTQSESHSVVSEPLQPHGL